MNAVVFVDADNTLWDTNGVFAAEQLALLSEIEESVGTSVSVPDRLAFVRSLDQSLAERHHAGLRYPPRLLIRAIALTLSGVPTDVATRQAWYGDLEISGISNVLGAQLEASFLARLNQTPQLRLGVREGLQKLQDDKHAILIVTEGPREKAYRTAAAHNLEHVFLRIIEGRKDARFFDRALKLFRTAGAAFMVGDQLDRDIRPAGLSGLQTIFFPGGFTPKWQPTEAEVRPDYVISDFSQVPAIVNSSFRSPAS
jgi:putative hydrolase of the HAD superfamily